MTSEDIESSIRAPDDDGPTQEAAVPPAYGQHAAKGFAFAMSSAILSRVLSFAGLIVMGWYVSASQWGIAAVATSVSTMAALPREFGLTQLINRHPNRFSVWATDAMWSGILLGLASGICVVIAAPISAHLLAKPVIIPTLVMALVWMTALPGTVAITKLGLDFRFRLNARIATMLQIATTVLGIVFAIMGFGVYAVVLPTVVVSVIRLAISIYLCPVPDWKWLPSLSRLRVILINGWPIALATTFVTIVLQGDNFILAWFHNEAIVGNYAFAWQIGGQLAGVLGLTLAAVLLPIFGQLRHDFARQRVAFLKSVTTICLVGMPTYALQAALARPALTALWGEKWNHAVVPLMILSFGMSFRLLITIVTPMLWSQGRLKEYLWLCAGGAVAFVLIVLAAAPFQAQWAVPLAVSIFYIANDSFSVIVALVDHRRKFTLWRATIDLFTALRYPLVISLTVFAVCWPLAMISQPHIGGFGTILIVGMVGVGIQCVTIYVLQRQVIEELINHIAKSKPIVGRWASRLGFVTIHGGKDMLEA